MKNIRILPNMEPKKKKHDCKNRHVLRLPRVQKTFLSETLDNKISWCFRFYSITFFTCRTRNKEIWANYVRWRHLPGTLYTEKPSQLLDFV